ncbi:MAG TPA: rod shape-determining protein MreC [Coriobacteriia bacterium]
MKRLEIDKRTASGNPILLAALIVVSLVLMTAWYLEGSAGPLHGTRRVVLATSEPFAAAGSFLTTPFRAIAGFVSDSSISRQEGVALKKQNEQLKERLAELEEAKLEADRLRELVKFATAQDLATVGARVIGRPVASWDHSIIIDRGTDNGVQVGAAVIAAGGLVGQVVEATGGDAKVRLITDTDSGVAVLVQRTRAEGVVRGSVEGALTLDFVGKEQMPVEGDVLVTSGMGGAFPKGLVVGEVSSVTAPQVDLFPAVDVKTRVAIDRIEEVLVMTVQLQSQAGSGE